MKFMLNGAVTLGTWDGANIEIAECAGVENEYIFGARVEEINALKKGGYNPKAIIENNEELRKVVGTLIDGTFDDGGAKGPGSFGELYDALTKGTHWHDPDHYFLMRDLPEYIETKIRANADYANRREFGRKCLKNVANAGKFSSDRAILEYADEIWHVSHK